MHRNAPSPHRTHSTTFFSVATNAPSLHCTRSLDPTSLDPDMTKLNEYLQAEKANSINVEGLFGDLQKRYAMLKTEWMRTETERQAMRKALRAAQAGSTKLAAQNERLTAVLSEVNREQDRLVKAKTTVMEALGMGDKLNITDVLRTQATSTD